MLGEMLAFAGASCDALMLSSGGGWARKPNETSFAVECLLCIRFHMWHI